MIHGLSVLAKWLARKTRLKKPNLGEGIFSRKLRPKSAHDFLDLLYCFIVLLCICVVSCPYVIYYPTVIARYSLFVLKVPLNTKQANKQRSAASDVPVCIITVCCDCRYLFPKPSDVRCADWKQGVGFVSAEMIQERLPAPGEDTIVLICGPPPMIQHACNPALDKLGYPDKQRFVF